MTWSVLERKWLFHRPSARGTETPPQSHIAKVAATYSGPGPTIMPTRAPFSSSPSPPVLSTTLDKSTGQSQHNVCQQRGFEGQARHRRRDLRQPLCLQQNTLHYSALTMKFVIESDGYLTNLGAILGGLLHQLAVRYFSSIHCYHSGTLGACRVCRFREHAGHPERLTAP